jgi:hypothetical protein
MRAAYSLSKGSKTSYRQMVFTLEQTSIDEADRFMIRR